MTSSQPGSGAGIVAAVQGIYFLITGIWPLVHMESFLAVTGQKTDLWLVQTVGVLISVVGTTLLLAASSGRVTWEVLLLGIGAAGGLAAVDVIFVGRGVIPAIYLSDAVLEAVFILSWATVALRSRTVAVPRLT